MLKILFKFLLLSNLFAGQYLQAEDISGSMRSYPLHSQWLNDFARDRGSDTGKFFPVGEKAALERLKKKQIPIISMDSSATAIESSLSRVPVAKGAMVLAFNLPNFTGKLTLSPALLEAIFKGEVRTWSDPKLLALNPGLANLKAANILPVYSKRSEENEEFLKYLSREGSKIQTSLRIGVAGEGQDGVSSLIEQNAGALGFVSLSYALGRNLRLGEIQDSKGKHGAERIFAQGSTYPLIFTSYLVAATGIDAFSQSYLQFVLSKGQNRLPPGFGSLSVTERAEAIKILQGLQKGSL